MRLKKRNISVQKLIGITAFTDYGLETSHGILLFFAVTPTNISVLSTKNIGTKIHHLMMVLSAFPELEIACTDASECFDDNRLFLTGRKDYERNANVRSLLQKDIVFLDQMQIEMTTSRQFLMIGRCKNSKPEQVFQTANRLEKIISEQGFEIKRLKKPDIKRLLALYFDASFDGEQMPDIDGAQYLEQMTFDLTREEPDRQTEISRSAPYLQKDDGLTSGGIEIGGSFGGFERDG